MAYTTLGSRAGGLDHLRAALAAQMARRGPAHVGRPPSGPAARPDGRERMEERYAKKATEERLEKAFWRKMGQERDQHDLAMRQGEDQLVDAGFARDLATRQQAGAESATAGQQGIEMTREERLRDAMERGMGLDTRRQDFLEGPAYGLQERQAALGERHADESERRHRALEDIDRSRVTQAETDSTMSLVGALGEDVPPDVRGVVGQMLLDRLRGGSSAVQQGASTMVARNALQQLMPQITDLLRSPSPESRTRLQELLSTNLPGMDPTTIRSEFEALIPGLFGPVPPTGGSERLRRVVLEYRKRMMDAVRRRFAEAAGSR